MPATSSWQAHSLVTELEDGKSAAWNEEAGACIKCFHFQQKNVE
jgi:hypothetical protein